MLDHMTFRVRDIARTRDFYSAALAPLGYTISFEGAMEGVQMLGFSHADANEPNGQRMDVWFIDGTSPYGQAPATTSCHLCWRAARREQVDAFHQAALAAGGKDYGAPGLRPHDHPHYYGAFVIDPEGNNIEAVCHSAQ